MICNVCNKEIKQCIECRHYRECEFEVDRPRNVCCNLFQLKEADGE
jgi:hypothetical protein